MCKQNVILLKLTGEFLQNGHQGPIDSIYVRELARQIKALQATHYFGIVVGGGNFFRGKQEGAALGMRACTSDYVGMLATLMNGTILHDLLAQEGLETELFSALDCTAIARPISPQNIETAMRTKDCLIFAGGLGTPFFTTDTTAIVRALQIQAREVWKVTKVDGIYTADPRLHPNAQRFLQVTYNQVLQERLEIMDETAIALAREHGVIIRVFSLFAPQALIKAAHESSFGSKIVP